MFGLSMGLLMAMSSGCGRVINVFIEGDAGLTDSPTETDSALDVSVDTVDGGLDPLTWLRSSGDPVMTSLEAMDIESDSAGNWYVLFVFHGALRVGQTDYFRPDGGVVVASFDRDLNPRWSHEITVLVPFGNRFVSPEYENLDLAWRLDREDDHIAVWSANHAQPAEGWPTFGLDGSPQAGLGLPRLQSGWVCVGLGVSGRWAVRPLLAGGEAPNLLVQNGSSNLLLARVGYDGSNQVIIVSPDLTAHSEHNLGPRAVRAIDTVGDDFVVVTTDRSNPGLPQGVTDRLNIFRIASNGVTVWQRDLLIDFPSEGPEISVDVSPDGERIAVAGAYNGRAQIIPGADAYSLGLFQPFFVVVDSSGSVVSGSRGTPDFVSPDRSGIALAAGAQSSGSTLLGGWATIGGAVALGGRSTEGGGFLFSLGAAESDFHRVRFASTHYTQVHALVVSADDLWSVAAVGSSLFQQGGVRFGHLRLTRWSSSGESLFSRDYEDFITGPTARSGDTTTRNQVAFGHSDGSVTIVGYTDVARISRSGEVLWRRVSSLPILPASAMFSADGTLYFAGYRGGRNELRLDGELIQSFSAAPEAQLHFPVVVIGPSGELVWSAQIPVANNIDPHLYLAGDGLHVVFISSETAATVDGTWLRGVATDPGQVVEVVLREDTGAFEVAHLLLDSPGLAANRATYQIPHVSFSSGGKLWGLVRANDRHWMLIRLDSTPITEFVDLEFDNATSVLIEDVMVRPDQSLVLVGYWQSPAVFGSLGAPAGPTDSFVARLNPDFTFASLERIGGGGTDELTAALLAPEDSLYLGGTFEVFAGMRGLTVQGVGTRDALIARLPIR